MFRIFAFITSFLFFSGLVHAASNDIVRISVDSDGTTANAGSYSPAMSATGQYIVYSSDASDIVSDDGNAIRDIFLYNRTTGKTTRISLDSDGNSPNASSDTPSISEDGRYIVYMSHATDLVTGDSATASDIFLYDTQNTTTKRINLDTSDESANGDSSAPQIAGDASYVAFQSDATDLVSSDTNGKTDIFDYDVGGDTVALISEDKDGGASNGASTAPSISQTGAYIAFQSDASDLVDDDTNGTTDIFVYDRNADTISIISNDSDGNSSNGASTAPSIVESGTGYLVVFESVASDLVASDTNATKDIFLYKSSDGSISRLSIDANDNNSNGASHTAKISKDGKYVIFLSDATDLVSSDDNNTAADGYDDVFVRDIAGETTKRVSVKHGGENATAGDCTSVAIDADGSYYAFACDMTDLVPSDGNAVSDIFAWDEECASDSDDDGTVNCNDECPYDEDKTATGDCGCGTADTDTDSDGTADCDDGCPSDANKTAAGACGCGVSDDDNNGNGQADCEDITTETVPKRPNFQLRGRAGRMLRLKAPANQGFVGVTYSMELLQRKGKGWKAVKTKETTKNFVVFKNLKAKTRYAGRYSVKLGTTQSKNSAKRTRKTR